jgi:hypothetical protein
VIPPVVADTGGLLRALARIPGGKPSFPEYERILTSAAAVIVPALVLAEVEYFLGLVDGTVAAVAERRRVHRVLTSDRWDFGAIRVGPRFTRALESLP